MDGTKPLVDEELRACQTEYGFIMERYDGLADALTHFWVALEARRQLEDGREAFIDAHARSGNSSISHKAVRQWMLRIRHAITSGQNGSEEWLVVGVAVAPWSIEESALMLLAAEDPNWVYVPIDISLPLARQLEMMTVARADWVVTLPETLLGKTLKPGLLGDISVLSVQEERSENVAFRTLCVAQLKRDEGASLRAFVRERVRRDDEGAGEVVAPLYVLFTSGSTGQPKGVLGTRAGAWERLRWMWRCYPFESNQERVARTVKLTFVDSIWEILGAFLQRIPLVHIANSSVFGEDRTSTQTVSHVMLDESSQFLVQVSKYDVTRFTAVPSVFNVMLVQYSELELRSSLSKLRYLLLSGETLSLSLVRKITSSLPQLRVLNLYGSTEVAGDVTCAEVSLPFLMANQDKWEKLGVPIGTIDEVVGSDTSLLLVQTSGRVVGLPTESAKPSSGQPVEGELWVSGPAVALAYASLENGVELLGNHKLSSSLATRPPKSSNHRAHNWFKTRDICTIVDKYVYFLGRRDRLVKIRGQRVQLDAVERLVFQGLDEIGYEQLQSCQVIAFDTEVPTKYGFTHHQLVVCIIQSTTLSKDSGSKGDYPQTNKVMIYPRKGELCRWIANRFGPAYVPNSVCEVRSLALARLPNGKLDRRALVSLLTSTAPPSGPQSQPNNLDDNVVEFVKQTVWTVLRISPDRWEAASSSSFEALGADSLLTSLLHFELKQHFPRLEVNPVEMQSMTPNKLILHLCDTESSELSEHSLPKLRSETPPAKRLRLAGSDLVQRNPTASAPLVGLSRSNRTSTGKVLIPTILYPRHQKIKTASMNMALVWSADLKKCVDASPLVVLSPNGQKCAIIGSHAGIVVCVDLHGRELWTTQLDDRIEASASISERFSLVFVGTYSGTLYAVDVWSGRIIWTYQCGGMIKATALPIDSRGIVAVGAYDSKLHAINVEDGTESWSFHVGASIFSASVTTNDQKKLWFATTGGDVILLAVCNGPDQIWKKKLPAPVFSGLAVDEPSSMLVVGCADGNIYGLSASTGETQWAIATNKPVFSSPCLYENRFVIIGSHDGCLRKVDTTTGRVDWSTQLDGPIFSSPAIFRAASSSTETMKSGDSSLLCCAATIIGSVYLIDEETGSEVECVRNLGPKLPDGDREKPIGEIFSSPVIVDGLCIIGTRSNALLALQI